MKRKGLILFLALGHGLNDLLAGYFMGRLVLIKTDLLQVSLGLFLYNALAFGGQYPAALLLEKTGNPKQFLLWAYALNVLAVLLFVWNPSLSILLAGVASALYHVAGGTVCAEQNRATDIGLFAAPGVAGLIAGGYFAYAGIGMLPILTVAAVLFLGVLFYIPLQKTSATTAAGPGNEKGFSIDRHDIIMMLLLTVISLRSVIWNIFQLIHEHNYTWLLAIAAAAVTGKIAGGWLADRIGWRRYAMASLVIATPILHFFRDELLLFCTGIGLLQSGIPATTAMLVKGMEGKTARAIGLSFGLAIALGGLVFYSPLQPLLNSPAALWILASVMILLLAADKHAKNKYSLPARL